MFDSIRKFFEDDEIMKKLTLLYYCFACKCINCRGGFYFFSFPIERFETSDYVMKFPKNRIKFQNE